LVGPVISIDERLANPRGRLSGRGGPLQRDPDLGADAVGARPPTPALSSFITSLGSAWVPLLIWLWLRTAVPRLALLGIGLGILGTGILAEVDSGSTWVLGAGDLLTLFASMVFAVQILLLDRFGQGVQSAHLTVGFIGITGVLSLLLATAWAIGGPGLAEWFHWTARMLSTPTIALDVGLLTVFSTVLAFHWMNTYQPQVSPSRAALIYLLEPVFASLFSLLWGYDHLTPRLLLGGGIILGGNLLVELPRLLRKT
jgi:drug/metabolite transporter (DMT)-like permease